MYERQAGFEADLAAAKDPATDEKELVELLNKHYGEMEIAEAIALNPSCPQRLFAEFWNYMDPPPAANPALEEHQAHGDWERMTRSKPRVRFNGWSSSVSSRTPQIHRALYVMRNGDGAYQRLVMGFESIPAQVIREHVASKSAPLRKTIASRETAPDEVFEQLARDSARTVRQAVAANPHAPANVIAILASDKEETVAEAARANPACPDEAVHQARLKDASKATLADSDVSELKFPELAKVAGDGSTPSEKLAQLAAHDDECIRFLAGINPSTPAETLARLAQDATKWVRASAAFNPNTPQASLAELLDSDDLDIQVGLASNSSLSEEDQLKLAESACSQAGETLANLTQYPAVWKKLTENVEPTKKAQDKTWRHYLAEALGAKKPGKFTGLERSRDSRYLFVSRIAARSEMCPDSLACHYAHYAFDDYSHNPQAALALLEGKTHVKAIPYKEWKMDMWLSEGAAPGHVTNYYIQSDHEKRRAQSVENWTTQMRYLLPFVLDPNTNTRKRLAGRRDLIRFVFEMLARDEKPGVREAIAKNKRTPRSVLSALAGDKATTVRTVAARRAGKSAGPKAKFVNQGSATDRVRVAKDSESAKLLTEMAADRATSVRVAVADNRNLPEEVLTKLAEDKDAKVRRAVALRTRDLEVVRRLLTDSDKDVRLAAAHPGRWRRYSRESGYSGDQEFLSWLLDAQDAENRAIAAEHIEDEALQEKFMHDPDALVQRHLARNKNLSSENKLRLAHMTDDQETLAALANKTDNEELFLLTAGKITSSHAEDPIRCHGKMMARPTVQDRLCSHPLPMIRGAVANQSTLTEHARAVLSEDSEDWVRRRVRPR